MDDGERMTETHTQKKAEGVNYSKRGRAGIEREGFKRDGRGKKKDGWG